MDDLRLMDEDSSILVQIITPPMPIWAVLEWSHSKEVEGGTVTDWLGEYVFLPVIAIEVWKEIRESRTWYSAVVFGLSDYTLCANESSRFADSDIKIKKHNGQDYILTIIGYTTDKEEPVPKEGFGNINTQTWIQQ